MRALVAGLVGLGLALAGPASAQSFKAGETYTFGIVPQQSASRLAKMWGPFLAELSARTGAEFQFRTTKDIPTFEACLASGRYDIAYMNPMHYAVFSKETAYRAIAHQTEKRLRGILVARVDATFEDLSGLQGQPVAFPSPGAFGASILTRAALTENGVSFEPKYVKSHDSVYRAVAAGLMPAGGGVGRTFNATDPAIRAQLKVIHKTEGYTPHAIAVHATFSAAQADQLQAALMEIAAAQPDLVQGIGMKGFVAAQDGAWDDVRNLGMARAETGISHKGEVQCPSD